MALRGDEWVVQMDLGAGFVSILTARSNGFSQAREIVDTTTKASGGNRTLLAGGGVASRTISLEGVLEEDSFYAELQARFEAGSLDTYRLLHLTSGIQYEGSFQVSAFDFSDNYNDAVTYSLTLESSGAVTNSDTIS